LHILYSA
jgi:hypothetical protein